MLRALALAAFAAVSAVAAQADDHFKPAVIYDTGGKFDGSFNEAAFNGAEAFKADTGVDYREFEIDNDSQREQILRRFARDGFGPIVAIGFRHAAALEKVAADFPDTQFAIIDAEVALPNVRSISFNEHEGSYLVGILAAMAADGAPVGFVGGMDIPLIRKFACGYVGGVKSVDPDADVFQNMTGTTGAAWNDPVKGAELATSQIDRGAEVVYHAAGGTGRGVLQAAADAGKLGIGVDSNQNGLHPGQVLTSMLKRVDIAVYDAFSDAMNDAWSAGFRVLGLAERGVGFAEDDNNAALLTDAMRAAVYEAAYDIVTGEVVVHDYMSDSACPY